MANEIVKQDTLTASERFTNLVVREYLSTAPQGAFELSAVQKRLIQGWIDISMKAEFSGEWFSLSPLKYIFINGGHYYGN